MTQDEIIRMAREAGFLVDNALFLESVSLFERFAALVAAHEREACAKVCDEIKGWPTEKVIADECAAAIRAIKFEGDTGFRPVSEMVAEHKQDPKKAAAIEKAKVRKATRAEKIAMPGVYEVPVEQAEQEPVAEVRVRPLQGYESTPKIDVEWLVRPTPGFLYAAPVRTKDLTDDEIRAIRFNWERNEFAIDFARAVIAADREKNK